MNGRKGEMLHHVCVRERERECARVCVCVRERERERERKKKNKKKKTKKGAERAERVKKEQNRSDWYLFTPR